MKSYIIGAVVGASILATVFSVWLLIAQNRRIATLENFAAQVTQLINSAQQQKTP